MPLFEATSFSIAKPICNGSSCSEHSRSRMWNFLRLPPLIQLNPVIMVTTYTKHNRSRKYHFLGEMICQENFHSHCDNIFCTYWVQKMPLFEATPVTIGFSSCNDYGTKHIWSIKCHFLRQPLLLQLNPVSLFTAFTEHTRSR